MTQGLRQPESKRLGQSAAQRDREFMMRIQGENDALQMQGGLLQQRSRLGLVGMIEDHRGQGGVGGLVGLGEPVTHAAR